MHESLTGPGARGTIRTVAGRGLQDKVEVRRNTLPMETWLAWMAALVAAGLVVPSVIGDRFREGLAR